MSTITITPPDRSLEQCLIALAKGNEHRTRRAILKQDIRAGRRYASPIIADVPEWAATMKVADLLLAVPKVGRVKVAKALKCVEVAPSKTVGGLSDRQRRELLGWLHGR
jgi:hypothetical protein